jgi:hypothetical protein
MTLRRLARIATALAALAILAGPAWSARVVEVRIGSHPKFTRVVFELDAPAGYRVERRAVDGGSEFVVELSAASAPRKLKSGSPLVAGVDLEPSGTQSVARVRMRGGSPRVKELILGGPPRIVLDFMLPDEVASAPPVAKTPVTAPAPDAPSVVAQKDTPDAAGPGPKQAMPEAVRDARKPVTQAPKADGATAAAKPVEKTRPPQVAETPQPPQVAEKAQPPVAAPKLTTPSAPKPADASIAKVESALEGERIVQPKVAQPDLPKPGELASPAPVPTPSTAAVEPPKPGELASPAPAPTPGAPAVEPPKPVAKSPSELQPKPLAKAPTTSMPTRTADSKGPFGLSLPGSDPWLTLGLVAAGLLLFLIVVVSLLRRHSKPTSLDALELAREAGGPMESADVFETISAAGTSRTTTAQTSFPVAGPGLFDDEREKGESEMDVAMDLPIEREPRGTRAPSMDSDSGLGPLVQELERRMAQLERRLDEANEARERLERQVTAQSEELRVQRAAIARTQRALRGMTRIGEEQATEPALRDPGKPSAGRG